MGDAPRPILLESNKHWLCAHLLGHCARGSCLCLCSDGLRFCLGQSDV